MWGYTWPMLTSNGISKWVMPKKLQFTSFLGISYISGKKFRCCKLLSLAIFGITLCAGSYIVKSKFTNLISQIWNKNWQPKTKDVAFPLSLQCHSFPVLTSLFYLFIVLAIDILWYFTQVKGNRRVISLIGMEIRVLSCIIKRVLQSFVLP